jgi:hypothetical protein
MRLSIALLALLATTGCASFQAQKFTGPNGHPAYLMQCSGFGRTAEGCAERAAKLCHGAATVIDRPTGVPGLPQLSGGTLMPPERMIAYECNQG